MDGQIAVDAHVTDWLNAEKGKRKCQKEEVVGE